MDRILEAFTVYADLINELGGGSLSFEPENVSVSDGSEAASESSDRLIEDNTLSVPVVIGATAGCLAVILFAVLMARRSNQADDQISHLKLEEDGDDTFVREYASTGSAASQEGNYESRNVHVVGESDSIFSGWTGYTKNGARSVDEMDGQHVDVHRCSSATCEVCEQKRQQGVEFIPTTSSIRIHLPHGTERNYVAADTVEL